jgi:hypothetical protein
MVLLFSMMMLMDCEMKFVQASVSLSQSDRLLACTGAYNIGVRGFQRHALYADESKDLDDWITNLKNSGSPQKYETINHLVSINRCSDKSSNYPPCGTEPSYCQSLEKTNPCGDSNTLKCIGECQ